MRCMGEPRKLCFIGLNHMHIIGYVHKVNKGALVMGLTKDLGAGFCCIGPGKQKSTAEASI